MTAIKKPHDKDLSKRFYEIDYVSEFQKYWAIFNKWFKNETKMDWDRRCIESLKQNPKINVIIHFLAQPYSDPLIRNVNEGIMDYYIYSNENCVSNFVKRCWHDPLIRGDLNTFQKKQSTKGVRGTASIHLDLKDYRIAYSIKQMIYARNIALTLPINNMDRFLSFKGIKFTGSLFFRMKKPLYNFSSEEKRFYSECYKEIMKDGALNSLKDLITSHHHPGLTHDIIEMLYLVRNTAIHGDLDYLNRENNRTARSGLILLNDLMKYIIAGKYYCTKCGYRHVFTSSKGQEHRNYYDKN